MQLRLLFYCLPPIFSQWSCPVHSISDVQRKIISPDDIGLPTWEGLLADLVETCRQSPGVHQAILPYKDSPPRGIRHQLVLLGCRISRHLPQGSDVRKLCEPDWHTLYYFVLEQIYRNATLSDDERSTNWIFGPHHQLPCSAATLENRVALIKQHVALDQPLLIIGDDDMQSLRLAEEGFTDITTIEIDPVIARLISDAGAQKSRPIKVVCQSIEDVDDDLVSPYGAILMDPPCNPKDLTVFLDGAHRLSAGQPGSKLFLSTHLLSHGEDGYNGLRQILADHGYRGLLYEPAFNRYPVPRVSMAILNAMVRIAVPAVGKSPAHFFVSDLVVLESR